MGYAGGLLRFVDATHVYFRLTDCFDFDSHSLHDDLCAHTKCVDKQHGPLRVHASTFAT